MHTMLALKKVDSVYTNSQSNFRQKTKRAFGVEFPAFGREAKGQNYSNFLTLKTKKFCESPPIEEREKVSTLS